MIRFDVRGAQYLYLMETSTHKIGWIGLGIMGTPMATHLLKAGYPVSVYNRNRAKEKPLVDLGATTARSPEQLLAGTDTVFLMVTDDKAIAEIFNGDEGLASSLTAGKRIINMSTVSPGISRQMAALCTQKGAAYIDAPVSGSLKQAQEASLVIIAGCDEKEFEPAKELLQHLGKMVMRVGGIGAGNAAKLAINLLLAIQAQGLAEATLFAGKNGISREDFFSIFNNGAMSNTFGKIKSQAIADNNYKPAFALKNIVKDLRLAHDEGLQTPLGLAALDTYQNAASAFNEEDIIAVFKFLERE
jgi:3-hydroxyisobutyrate dehydrogenase